MLKTEGRYVLIGHDAFGTHGRRVLGSIPRLLGLTARALVTPQLRGADFASPDKPAFMAVLPGLLGSG